MKLLQALFYSGHRFGRNPMETRGILLSNQISIVLAGLSFILFPLYFFAYGLNFVTFSIPLGGVLCMVAIALNSYGFTLFSRFWICLFIPLITTSVSIYSKIIYYENQQELDYFTFRFITLVSCVFPFILFSLKEKTSLIISSALGLGILMLHDTLHNGFGVGYHQSDKIFLSRSTYYFTNIVILLTYCIMVGAVFFLKWISEKNETKNIGLIVDLNSVNDDLLEKNIEIEAQSMEILAQSEVLNENQQKLIKAYAEIERHKNFLSKENKTLTTELIEKNAELVDTNTELIKHNNELRQFSYTVSHNLRGPIARLLGLINLINAIKLADHDQAILDHFKTSVYQLDTIIHDLGKIIDIRHDIFKIRQQIKLEDEIGQIEKILIKEIQTHHVKIHYDFSNCPIIYSVKPMVHSILYNLISNSIKYRSLDRPPEITITSQEGAEHVIIQVKDNGLGIDLARHKDELFKLYKRFNYHTEGKGLGLYLVKLQCEALGGSIDAKSELNKSTTFTFYLSKPRNITRQILHDDKHATIFYDAQLNTMGITWNAPTSIQYRSLFRKCAELLTAYHTPNWISDITNQGVVSDEDRKWMITTILPEAARIGLRRIAIITPAVPEANYVSNIQAAFVGLKVEQAYFNSIDNATEWIRSEHEKVAIKNDADEFSY